MAWEYLSGVSEVPALGRLQACGSWDVCGVPLSIWGAKAMDSLVFFITYILEFASVLLHVLLPLPHTVDAAFRGLWCAL